MLARPAAGRNEGGPRSPVTAPPAARRVAQRGRDRVGDLGLGHQVVGPVRVQGHLGDGQSGAQFEQGADGHHVDQLGLAQEVDVEAGGHRQGHRTDLADDHHPCGAVGQGHQGGAGHRAPGAAVGLADREAQPHGGRR